METQRVLVDTSILIDYFRKRDKSKTILYKLSNNFNVVTSSVCYFEIFTGVKEIDLVFVNKLFEKIEVISFTRECAYNASKIYKVLKKKNEIIEFRDLFIGATATTYNLELSTLNKKHFDRIKEIKIFDY